MATPSDAQSATGNGMKGVGPSDLDAFFDQLDLQDEEFDDIEIDMDDSEIRETWKSTRTMLS